MLLYGNGGITDTDADAEITCADTRASSSSSLAAKMRIGQCRKFSCQRSSLLTSVVQTLVCVWFSVPYDAGSFVGCTVESETPDLRCAVGLGAQSSMDPMSTDMPGDEFYDDDMPDLPDDDDDY